MTSSRTLLLAVLAVVAALIGPASARRLGLRAFGALLLGGARAVDEGALSRADAPDVVFHTLLEGLGA